jgi:hypothetical protein
MTHDSDGIALGRDYIAASDAALRVRIYRLVTMLLRAG